ncbi:Phosphocarrier protein HPr [Actinomyces viscosus]|uniref:Phosphocarrier protein HPr n=1 Tax=Actinomyces viscosus TaxID=1656 RepID=A0A448PPZ0_ACTVI|nr:Phosphocarrier protein HPr [Actinomyces viscosus]
MAQVTATIASKVGLHARPAATFVKAVAEKGVPVTIAKEGGAAVDASSILGVMTWVPASATLSPWPPTPTAPTPLSRSSRPPGDRPGRLITATANGARSTGARPVARARALGSPRHG